VPIRDLSLQDPPARVKTLHDSNNNNNNNEFKKEV
jgi:hypothetical protein